MKAYFRSLVLAGWLSALPFAGWAAGVDINEVMFNPSGDDTGGEWVELYNPTGASRDMSGWQFYLDDAGYFIFPVGFGLEAGKYVVVHLRASGVNSASDLYYPGASSNMGNSSGSLALFTAGTRSKDTIRSYLRYHKPGSTEKKTWETAAADAGLWQIGTFIDISSFLEGSSLGLAADGVTVGFRDAWKFFTSPTPGLANAAAFPTGGDASPAASATSETTISLPSPGSGSSFVPPELKVAITAEAHGVAGALHTFRGRAFSLERKALAGPVRYLWNFGDGSVAEGASVNHTYRFPGVYTASLAASLEEASGFQLMDIRIEENAVRIAQVFVGPDGFVELTNGSGEILDIGGWFVGGEEGSIFSIPQGTRVRGHAAILFPNEITKLSFSSTTVLRLTYGNGRLADNYLPHSPAPTSEVAPLAAVEASFPAAVLQAAASRASHEDPGVIAEGESTTVRHSPPTFASIFFFASTALGAIGGILFAVFRRLMV